MEEIRKESMRTDTQDDRAFRTTVEESITNCMRPWLRFGCVSPSRIYSQLVSVHPQVRRPFHDVAGKSYMVENQNRKKIILQHQSCARHMCPITDRGVTIASISFAVVCLFLPFLVDTSFARFRVNVVQCIMSLCIGIFATSRVSDDSRRKDLPSTSSGPRSLNS